MKQAVFAGDKFVTLLETDNPEASITGITMPKVNLIKVEVDTETAELIKKNQNKPIHLKNDLIEIETDEGVKKKAKLIDKKG